LSVRVVFTLGALLAALLLIPALAALPAGSVRYVLAGWVSARQAHAQPPPPPPVDVVVEGVFGPDALVEGGYGGLSVQLTNRTSTAFTGGLEVSVADFDSPAERHRVDVDLPPGETRRVQLTVFIPSSGVAIDARYVDDDDRLLGLGSQSVAYAAGATSIVVIADQPARLRAALLDLSRDETVPGGGGYPSYGSTRTVTLPIGGCSLDGRTGDPIVPRDPHAYGTVRLVIASAPTLARLGREELLALTDYVEAGGELVIAPRTPADHALPVVHELFGEVTPWTGAYASSLYSPPATPLYHCGAEGVVEDGVGCARPLGHGLLRLLPWDITTPPSAGAAGIDTATRSLVLRLVSERDALVGTAMPLGAGLDPTEAGWWDGSSTFAYVRRALDPNEGYRTSLALVAVLLFLYVIVVGPIHFRMIERRNQPTLALITTPLLALGCVVVLFFVGYLGKGIVMRYRRFAVVELAEGSERAYARSYTGYFYTRPASASLDTAPGTFPRRVAAPSGIAGPRYLHREDGVDAESMRGGLWDTLFVREDRMLSVPGGVRFEVIDGRIASVINDSDLDVRTGILVDRVGSAFVVGDVPAHGRAPVPTVTGWYLYEAGGSWYGEGGDATTTTLMALLRMSSDETALARGMQSLLADDLVAPTPVFYGWIDAEPDPAIDPGFSREWDRRLLRVAVHAPVVSIVPAQYVSAETIGLSGDAARAAGLDTTGAPQ
jgi:hypothetical protein